MMLSEFLIASRKERMRIVHVAGAQTESPTVKTLVFDDTECAEAEPGQFLMVWIPGTDEVPFSILDANNRSVSIAVKRVGDATAALHDKNRGELVGVRGPFGNNFTLKDGRLLLVSGGTGAAPMVFLAKKLLSNAAKVMFLTGAQTKDELLFREKLEEHSMAKRMKIVWTTEDGSYGVRGLVTTQLDSILTKEDYDMVYTCGPEAMMQETYTAAQKYGVPIEASLERLMRCAIGICGSCVLGRYRVCKDGPVFRGDMLLEVREEFGISKRDFDGRKIALE